MIYKECALAVLTLLLTNQSQNTVVWAYLVLGVQVRRCIDLDIVRTATSANVLGISHIGMAPGAPHICPFYFFGTLGNEKAKTTGFEFDVRARVD